MREWAITGGMICFALLFVKVALQYVLLKNDLKKAVKQCRYIRGQNTNQIIYSETIDKDVCSLLNELNQILQESAKLKRQVLHEEDEIKNVITNLSHDLRTPVTSMIGYAQLLQKENEEEKRREYLEVILSRAALLRGLVEQLFSYSIAMEKKEYELQKVNMTDLLENVLLGFYHEFEEKNLSLDLQLEEEDVFVVAEQEALERTFLNLISNILKYAKGHVQIIQHGTTLEFRNQTEDIDSIDVEKIFDRFFTVAKYRTNGSMGLGLSIARRFITEMGGEIRAYKDGEYVVMMVRL